MQKLIRAAFASNPLKAHAQTLRTQMAAYLRARGVRVVSPKHAQILITIGGDGTILYNKNRYKKPVWAIGSDTSFICQSNKKRWKKELEPLLRGGFGTQKRLMLSSTLNGRRLPDALNEVVVRSQYHRVLELELSIGRRRMMFMADGLIFSTPTGSSAYAYSAGGREMKATARKWQIVPIAPYRRLFKPVALGEREVCRVRVVGRTRADAVVDGQMHRPIRGGSELIVRVAGRDFEFVKVAGRKK
ncbi:NAD kinase [uncultured archaeon]|nr:NAD kinase [uncultured archaeon]